ncbi:MAG TPA: Bcr/CflA family efflux MFS transporter [Sulfitobacter sp.]|nr:Bcr/CflA family efflux MFS transporter [Sulfitobacter sp.]
MSDIPKVRYLDRTTPPHISTLILLAGLSAMVMNIFLPSLPKMAEHFGTDYAVIQLSVPLYLFFSGILQIFIGPISDNLGRRRVMLWGLGIFSLATVGCLLAPNIAVFLVFRMAQAVIATGMVLSRAVIRDLYTQDESASMIGYVTMGMALVPMISPALGGLLEQGFGWQASFWAMLILGGLVFWVAWADLGETARASGKSLRQQFGEYPELLRSPRFWGYALATGFCSGAFFAYLGGAPFVGTVVFGMEPAVLGLYFGAPAIGYFIGNFITARTATRFGVNTLVLWGCISNAVGGTVSLLIFLAGYGSPLSFFGLMTLVGLGNGLCIPNATAGMLSVRPHLAGSASGLSGALSVALGAVLTSLTGALVAPENAPFVVLGIILCASILALASALYVRWVDIREPLPEAG